MHRSEDGVLRPHLNKSFLLLFFKKDALFLSCNLLISISYLGLVATLR